MTPSGQAGRGGGGQGGADFDFVARPYRFLEYVALGPLLQRTRMHFLPSLRDRRQALLFGDGDGRFLAALLAGNRLLVADAVDSSATMLRLLGERCAPLGASGDLRLSQPSEGLQRLRLYHESALSYVPDGLPDLVVSHFFFDCLTQAELDGLVCRIAPRLAPDAVWLVSDFRIPEGGLRVPSLVYVRLLYFAFRLLTGLRVTHLPDHASALARAGFERVACHRRMFGLLTSELWRRVG